MLSWQGILINGQFPGPPIEAVTNDNLIISVFNALDEPFLISWLVPPSFFPLFLVKLLKSCLKKKKKSVLKIVVVSFIVLRADPRSSGCQAVV